jgi:hypothetical protein
MGLRKSAKSDCENAVAWARAGNSSHTMEAETATREPARLADNALVAPARIPHARLAWPEAQGFRRRARRV